MVVTFPLLALAWIGSQHKPEQLFRPYMPDFAAPMN
jgi:hypothetical protein